MEMKIIDIDKIACNSFGDSPVEGIYIKCPLLSKIFKDNNVPEWFNISKDSVKFSGDVYWNEYFGITPPKTKIEIVNKVIGFIKGIANFDEETNYDPKKLIKELKENEDKILEEIEKVEWAQFLQVNESCYDEYYDGLKDILDNFEADDEDDDNYINFPEWIHITREYVFSRTDCSDQYNCLTKCFYHDGNDFGGFDF